MRSWRSAVRKAGLFVVALALVAAVWELYKAVGPEDGGKVLGWTLLPRTSDAAMPHTWDMVRVLSEPHQRGRSQRVGTLVLSSSWYSFQLAVVGLVLGVLVGLGLAIVLSRFRLARSAIYPYVIVSQTIPLIAVAPLIASWGGKLEIAGWQWPRWLSVALIASFLAFFPVSVGSLRGLDATPPAALELMRSYASGWGQTLRRVRLPYATPFILPSLRIAGGAAVIGAIVAEISMSQSGGIGRLIISYQQQATGSSARVYAAMLGGVLVGLAMAVLVGLVSSALTRGHPQESTS